MPKPRNLNPAYRFTAGVVRPVVRRVTKQDWAGHEHFPREGGFVVCPNHLSHVDVFAFAHFVYDSGREPYLLGKESVFRIPGIGRIFAKAGMIPVYRESGQAAHAFRAAIDAIRAGKCVGIYPEGTLTRDPDLWPMTGKTGAARVALETRCPVIPVAQWGPQEILGRYQKKLRLFPRKVMHMRAGPPVDLTDLYDVPMSAPVLREATERIIAAITRELEVLRGEKAPEARFDARQRGVPVIGWYRPEDHPQVSLPGTEPSPSGGNPSLPDPTLLSQGEKDQKSHDQEESR
ncbi:MAG: lysophospholipid acyltransferase family protein [Dermatophilaceae bacterium]|nr:1-acyl-sn-glycerol-3-phosphate acyltransferase [Intrasporangiaceae bacterium]